MFYFEYLKPFNLINNYKHGALGNFEKIAILFALVTLMFVFQSCIPESKKENESTKRPSHSLKPTQLLENDKLVVVEDVSYTEIQKAIQDYCNLYNQERYQALPRMFKVSQDKFAITFPYDIEFSTFCVFVNYLHYPFDLKYNPNIRVWTTANKGEEWVGDPIANKKVMIYIPKSDDEYDNVHLVSQDNFSVIIGFAIGHHFMPLAHGERLYSQPEFSISNLNNLEFEDFE